MTLKITRNELSDIVTALRCKAQGDREVAALLKPSDPPCVQHLAKTLIDQADRQEALADRISNNHPAYLAA